jgi:creatinine amidohydrolase/Fe(II)-dependent formamide hydrolase-like protein
MAYFERIQLLPLGSYEYHGKELPPETDTVIANAVADSVLTKLSNTFSGPTKLLPPVTYGLSFEHVGMPTTAYVEHNTFYTFIREILRTVSAPKDLIVFINGHGGNMDTLAALEGEFNCTFQDRKAFFIKLFRGPIDKLCIEMFGENDVHAGSVEASLIAYYESRAPREYVVTLSQRVRGSLRFFRSSEIAPEGVIKTDPRVIADPEKGSMLHEAIAEYISTSILDLIKNLEPILEKQ